MWADGSLEGQVSMEQDVRPIVEELKTSWRDKLDSLDQLKGELNDELVQTEIDLRNYKDEVRHIQEQFKLQLNLNNQAQSQPPFGSKTLH